MIDSNLNSVENCQIHEPVGLVNIEDCTMRWSSTMVYNKVHIGEWIGPN